MKELFYVRTSFPAVKLPCELEFDEYIPLNFRTFSAVLGCGYLHLGNGSTSLMDIAVEPGSQLVRALTLVSVPPVSTWPARFEIGRSTSGLPAISTSFDGYTVLRLAVDFEVSVSKDAILIYWKSPEVCDAMTFHQTDFLIQDQIWIGVQFRSLHGEQIAAFLAHLAKGT